MALSDLYHLTLRQKFGSGGEDLLTSWCFERLDGVSLASDLVAAFIADNSYLEAINSIQSGTIKNADIVVINLGDYEDFSGYNITGEGIQASDCLPAFAAVNFTFRLTTRAIRPGSKRIPGVAESVQTSGLITDATMLGLMVSAATMFKTSLPLIGNDGFRPVVIKRVKYPVPDTDPVRYAYRLPIAGDTVAVGGVNAVLANVKVSHQTSRGNGR